MVQVPDTVAATVIGLLSAGFLALMAAKLAAGRRWALWLFAIVYVIGTLGTLVSAIVIPQAFLSQPALLQASTILQFGLQTVAMFLIFTSTARQWFKVGHATTAP